MVFTVISRQESSYGRGKLVGTDRHEIVDGAQIYFYDRAAIHAEFDEAGLFEIIDVDEGRPFF
jgi:hypothetical protein